MEGGRRGGQSQGVDGRTGDEDSSLPPGEELGSTNQLSGEGKSCISHYSGDQEDVGAAL